MPCISTVYHAAKPYLINEHLAPYHHTIFSAGLQERGKKKREWGIDAPQAAKRNDGYFARRRIFCALPLTSELDAFFGANANPRLRSFIFVKK